MCVSSPSLLPGPSYLRFRPSLSSPLIRFSTPPPSFSLLIHPLPRELSSSPPRDPWVRDQLHPQNPNTHHVRRCEDRKEVGYVGTGDREGSGVPFLSEGKGAHLSPVLEETPPLTPCRGWSSCFSSPSSPGSGGRRRHRSGRVASGDVDSPVPASTSGLSSSSSGSQPGHGGR